jgi:hypothetical protein
VPFARCEACELLQGTLWTDRLEVLCAYPEAHPALSATHATGGDDVSEGTPASVSTRERRDAALALASAGSPPHTAADASEHLVFDTDWPDD